MLIEEVNEKTTAVYTATFEDDTGTVIPLADLTTLVVTLYSADDSTKAAINSRSAQDIKNVNNGTYHATSGLLTFELQTLDNVIVDTSLPRERHIMQFDFTYNSGSKTGRHTVTIVVKNLDKVT